VALAGIFFLVGNRRRCIGASAVAVAFGVINTIIAQSAMIWAALVGSIYRTPTWEILAFGPGAVLFLFFTSIKVLQIVIARIYGGNVSARITTLALVQTFRTIGHILAFVLTLPLRFFRRRERLDEMLQHWRR
jgi:hypothetical protein